MSTSEVSFYQNVNNCNYYQCVCRRCHRPMVYAPKKNVSYKRRKIVCEICLFKILLSPFYRVQIFKKIKKN